MCFEILWLWAHQCILGEIHGMKKGSLCWDEKLEEIQSAAFALKNVYPSLSLTHEEPQDVCLPNGKDLQDMWSISCECWVRIQPRISWKEFQGPTHVVNYCSGCTGVKGDTLMEPLDFHEGFLNMVISQNLEIRLQQ